MLPQLQSGPSSSTGVCPISPAPPLEPRSTTPSTTMPAPTPVPIVTTRKLSCRRPTPYRRSAMASAFTLFSTMTGRSSARRRVSPTRHLVPAELGRVDDAVALTVDGAGHADADAEHADGGAPGDEALEQRGEVGEEGRRGRVERLARGAHHRAVEPDLDERDVVGDDLDADGAPRAGGEPQHPGRAAALRGRVLELDDEPVGEQVLRELRHEGGRDAERRGRDRHARRDPAHRAARAPRSGSRRCVRWGGSPSISLGVNVLCSGLNKP